VEELRPCDSNARIGCDELCFSLLNVWAPLEKLRWDADRHLLRMGLLSNLQTTINSSWIVAKKNADRIFLHRDLASQIR